jgi:hypothetical protein
MRPMIILAAVVISAASSASAAPLFDRDLARPSTMIQEVRIVCEESGQCYRVPARRPVARWVYGDGAFYGPGPYVGPGNYGPPYNHTRWWWWYYW